MRFLGSKLFETEKTYRPKKKHKEGTQRYNLHKYAKTLVRSGDLAKSVQLPPGADIHHWLSAQTIDFYNITNVLYGSLTEFCTQTTCPIMSSGPRFEYMWRDPPEYPKATKVSAPKYVRLLMEWIERQINDERIFPTEDQNPYSEDFFDRVRNIIRRLFRVYAHVYYSHFIQIRDLKEESHLNTAFKHFMYFVWEFDLIPRDELTPLYDLLINIIGQWAKDKLDGPRLL
ncbi:unnamed protein product [Phytomonas sp. EM1]|nr:unnamed protein product [Phytomonas sp. EM1]|eukprot:CCW61074.1 unnamed protein product [Phytomonas sp. isolate EM1]